GEAGTADPRQGGRGRDRDLLDPCDRPCRAAVRAYRHHRRRQGALRGSGERRPQPSSSPGAIADAGRGRPVAQRAAPCRDAAGRRVAFRASGVRDRGAAGGPDRRRGRDRGTVDRATRVARCLRLDRRGGSGAGDGRADRGGTGGGGMIGFFQAASVIGRRDFVATVWSRTFLFFLLGPLIIIGMSVLFGSVSQRAARQDTRVSVAVIADVEAFAAIEAARERLSPAFADRPLPDLVRAE